MTKNKYLTELKRYLAEVSVGRRPLKLEGLADRVMNAHKNGVPSLDICESFDRYTSKPTYPRPIWARMKLMVHFQCDRKKPPYVRGPAPSYTSGDGN